MIHQYIVPFQSLGHLLVTHLRTKFLILLSLQISFVRSKNISYTLNQLIEKQYQHSQYQINAFRFIMNCSLIVYILEGVTHPRAGVRVRLMTLGSFEDPPF